MGGVINSFFNKVDRAVEKLSNNMIKTLGKKVVALLALMTIIDAFLAAIQWLLALVEWLLTL